MIRPPLVVLAGSSLGIAVGFLVWLTIRHSSGTTVLVQLALAGALAGSLPTLWLLGRRRAGRRPHGRRISGWRKLFASPMLRGGALLMVCGTGPLLVAIVIAHLQGDENPNPIGPGILAMCTFWPSLAMIGVGLMHGMFGAMAERKPPNGA